MPNHKVQKQTLSTKVSIYVQNDMLDEIKKEGQPISQYCVNAIKDKIYKKREDALMEMIDNFPRVSIEENTTDILRRYRNEE